MTLRGHQLLTPVAPSWARTACPLLSNSSSFSVIAEQLAPSYPCGSLGRNATSVGSMCAPTEPPQGPGDRKPMRSGSVAAGEEPVPEGLLAGRVDPQPLREVPLDRAVPGLHLVERRLQVLGPHPQDRPRHCRVAARRGEAIDCLLVGGQDVLVAPQ